MCFMCKLTVYIELSHETDIEPMMQEVEQTAKAFGADNVDYIREEEPQDSWQPDHRSL